jgi:type IV pilus assembly protein PilV
MHTIISATKKQQGVSLIEVLVSMIIFSVGILGMSTLQTRVIQENIDQRQRDVAIWQAQAIIDRISLNKTPAALTQYESSISSSTICDAAPATICAESYFGAAEVDAAICSITEMAIYDSWDTLCTNDQGAADVLRDLNAQLTCDSTPCVQGSNLKLRLLWRSLTAQSDPRFPTTTINDAATINDGPDVDGYIQVFRP